MPELSHHTTKRLYTHLGGVSKARENCGLSPTSPTAQPSQPHLAVAKNGTHRSAGHVQRRVSNTKLALPSATDHLVEQCGFTSNEIRTKPSKNDIVGNTALQIASWTAPQPMFILSNLP